MGPTWDRRERTAAARDGYGRRGRRLDQDRQDRQVVEVHIEGGHCQNCRLNADRQMTDGNSPRVGGRPPGGEGGVGRDIIGSRLPAPPLEGAGGKVRVASLATGPAIVATVAQQDKPRAHGVEIVNGLGERELRAFRGVSE